MKTGHPKVALRPLRLSDGPDIYRYAKDRAISKWTAHIPYPYPKNGATEFIRRSQRKARSGKLYNCAITLVGDDRLIGLIGLANINKEHKEAELGYWLGKPLWGQGIMSQAVPQILKIAFGKLKLHRVRACAFAANPASLRVLRKAGFVHEGTRRQARRRYGKWQDMEEFAMLESDYRKVKQKK